MYSNNGMFQPFHVESMWSPCGVHVESIWNGWSPCGVYMEWMESTWSLYGMDGVHVESMWSPCGIHVESMWTFHHSMWNLAIPSSFHVESRWNGDPKMSGITAKTYSMESTWSLCGMM